MLWVSQGQAELTSLQVSLGFEEEMQDKRIPTLVSAYKSHEKAQRGHFPALSFSLSKTELLKFHKQRGFGWWWCLGFFKSIKRNYLVPFLCLTFQQHKPGFWSKFWFFHRKAEHSGEKPGDFDSALSFCCFFIFLPFSKAQVNKIRAQPCAIIHRNPIKKLNLLEQSTPIQWESSCPWLRAVIPQSLARDGRSRTCWAGAHSASLKYLGL